MYVCICAAVSDKEIHELVNAGETSASAVMEKTGAGMGCGTCRASVIAMVEGETAPDEADASPLCGVRRLRMIRNRSSAA